MKAFLGVMFALSVAACATSFTGDAQFPGGVQGCAARCAESGLELESFVYAGEYSSACVCAPPGRNSSPAAGVVPPAVGVMLQTQRGAVQAPPSGQ